MRKSALASPPGDSNACSSLRTTAWSYSAPHFSVCLLPCSCVIEPIGVSSDFGPWPLFGGFLLTGRGSVAIYIGSGVSGTPPKSLKALGRADAPAASSSKPLEVRVPDPVPKEMP